MKVTSQSIIHQGKTLVTVDVRKGTQHVCAKCHDPVLIAKAYSQGIHEGNTIYHYAVHKYCMVAAATHGDYIKQLADSERVS